MTRHRLVSFLRGVRRSSKQSKRPLNSEDGSEYNRCGNPRRRFGLKVQHYTHSASQSARVDSEEVFDTRETNHHMLRACAMRHQSRNMGCNRRSKAFEI